MSEALEGVPGAPPPAQPKDAAVVILFRRGADGLEVFWLKREKSLRFAGGFYAFAGGRVDRADSAVPVEGVVGPAPLIVAAARELFEETGVLLAHGAERLGRARLDELRRRLLDGSLQFAALLKTQGLALAAADFRAAGRWVTPVSYPLRFDARFHLVEAPAGQEPEVWKGELESGEWIHPAEALARWRSGAVLLHPPNLHVMRVLERASSPESALPLLRHPSALGEDLAPQSAEFQRGVVTLPVRTPTLPPATHTNVYLLGTEELLIVDPGAPDEGENRRLLAVLRGLEGRRPKAIVLTHHHADHVGGLSFLRAELGLPVWAHEVTAQRLGLTADLRLAEGDVLELGGPQPMRWRVLHTPGHTQGHLCLVDEQSHAAVVGDMVAGLGTIVIDPPEGDMAEYVRQLERLKAHVGTLYPAHGPPIPDGVAKLDEYLAHRRWREGKVLAALAALGRPVELRELVPLAYDDVAAFVLPIAERSTHAILEKLHREGRARVEGGRWCSRQENSDATSLS